MGIWDVVPDDERERWELDPFARVGPLRFGMSPDETTAALGGVRPNPYQGASYREMTIGWFSELGLTLYHRPGQGLDGISVNARIGPQVVAEGVPRVGRAPSELEQWLAGRAECREPYTEVVCLPGAELASLTLGVVVCVQRAGDRLLTRPVFLPADAMDDVYHSLPREAWAISG